MPAVGIDPERARALAVAMRTAADGWVAAGDDLDGIGARYDLAEATTGARSALADMAGDLQLAATDLDARADLSEAIDNGRWHDVYGELVARLSRAQAGWEADTTGGPDAGDAVTVTRSSWEDLESRITGVVPTLPGALCVADAFYREAGSVVGPDGQAYPMLVPMVRNWEAGDDDPPIYTDDWGTPDGDSVATLLGEDDGWTTVAVETGTGRIGDDLSIVDQLLIAASGPAGANYLGATGFTPAPIDAYEEMRLDEYWVPNHIPIGERGDRPVPDATDEVAGVTPTMVVAASGAVRYEATVPASATAVLAGGAVQFVNDVATGLDNVQTVQDGRNVAYAVEYQLNDDGRTRAMIRSYQIVVGLDGEPYVSMGHVGMTDDGPAPVVAVSPRLHDGYAPAYVTNGIEAS